MIWIKPNANAYRRRPDAAGRRNDAPAATAPGRSVSVPAIASDDHDRPSLRPVDIGDQRREPLLEPVVAEAHHANSDLPHRPDRQSDLKFRGTVRHDEEQHSNDVGHGRREP